MDIRLGLSVGRFGMVEGSYCQLINYVSGFQNLDIFKSPILLAEQRFFVKNQSKQCIFSDETFQCQSKFKLFHCSADNIKNNHPPTMKIVPILVPIILLTFILQTSCQDSGDWQPPQSPENPNYLYCHQNRPKKCQSQQQDTQSSYVCGIHKTGIPKTYHDSCRACKDKSVFAFFSGPCQQTISKCPKDRQNCSFVTLQAQDSCIFESSHQPQNTSNNFCCKGDKYSHVMVGTCPILPETRCANTPLLIDVLESCPSLYFSRVCGRKKDGKKTTFENYCWACKDRDVLAYSEGPCP